MVNPSIPPEDVTKKFDGVIFETHEGDISKVERLLNTKFGEPYSKDVLYIISIQGPTSSGKSALGGMLRDLLEKENVYLLRLDDFYDMPNGSQENNKELDFDNPAMLNWNNIQETLDCIINRDVKIPVYIRDKEVRFINNNGINIIIIEGLYAFNCMSEFIFNIKEFDVYDSDKIISKEFVRNDKIKRLEALKKKEKTSNTFKDIKSINIRLTMCLNKMMSLRIKRDSILRGLSEDMIVERVKKFVWPDTLRWVYSDFFISDIDVIHGSFNTEGTMIILKCLKKYFCGYSCIDKAYDSFLDSIRVTNTDLSKDFMNDCSKECLLENSTITL